MPWTDDAGFDEQLPAILQSKAGIHFTPVRVAQCAAPLLAPHRGMRVLDVGAGPGKFCIVAARAVPDAEFVGVEYRPHFVRLATELAERSAVANVHFIEADALDLDWSEYDAFYFFNPFAEQLFDRTRVIDETVAFNPLNFVWNVAGAKERLSEARIGTRVVTYHGLGAAPPSGYECTFVESFGFNRVELWIKTSESTDRRVAEASR